MNVDRCPLESILEGFDECTRSATICLKKDVSTNCVAALVTAIKRGMHLSSARRVAKSMAGLSRSL
ncbi:Hypothetical protein FKW44_011719 [Caligus rogercresseyi]|uniref:Uncharacterized protein n=1 Tax=Caligus rogercresseyi TaxID=217165 RepID=A0A7T8K907_CALRO|nr:Hypothetical protein FKW44_011719 [Caligus rogercresseyi]